MISLSTIGRPSVRTVAQHLEEATSQAELGAHELSSAQGSTLESYQAIDGFQPATRDIARDTAQRDVSESARFLEGKAQSATGSAERSGELDGRALGSLDRAVTALDLAIEGLSGEDRRAAESARSMLRQGDDLWLADAALGTALAAINGGALPYIEEAKGDAPGLDVSFAAGEIHGTLQESLGYLSEAGKIQGASLAEVKGAVEILRSLGQKA